MIGRPDRKSVGALFGQDYGAAREIFRAAAKDAGASLCSYEHPLRGPSGESLSTDTAFVGDPDADQLLIVTSAVHGVEGFCGSAGQAGLLSSGIFAHARKAAALLVHAVNPYGFAHLRRTNEDNVDVNRNFVDHSHPPASAGYAELHELLVPDDWDGPRHLEADRALLALMAERGVRRVYASASRGQYEHPDGLFFGGTEPCWSNRIWHDILGRHAANRSRVVHLDLHTGLGRYGYGEVIYIGARSAPGFNRLARWLSEPVCPILGDEAVAPQVEGPLVSAVRHVAPDAEVIPLGLEFGTVSLFPVLRAMRADAWLNVHAATDAAVAKAIRAEVRSAFYVDDDEWRQMVVEQILQTGIEIGSGLER